MTDRVLPWETLGHRTTAKTARTALKQAGLDWTVSLKPAGFKADGKWHNAADRFYVTRDDTGDPLGEVSASYAPLQNVDAFEFFDEVITTGDVEYDTVGQLRGGRTIWLTAQVPEDILINGDDPVTLYLLLRNSHDGSSSVNLAITPVRVFCQNAINLALDKADDRWNVRHVTGMEGRVHQAQDALNLTARYADQFEQTANRLARTPMSETEFESFVDKFTKELELGDRAIKELKARSTAIFNDSPSLDNVRGSRWAALNSVVDYYEWERPRNENARLMHMWQYGPRYHRVATRLLKR